jgi:hypothetical protein
MTRYAIRAQYISVVFAGKNAAAHQIIDLFPDCRSLGIFIPIG